MTITYKIACFTDPHLGYKQYGLEQRREDMIEAFKDAIRICVEQKVDFIIIPGDFTDNKFISLKTISEVYESVSTLDLASIYGITGNHDDQEYSWMDAINIINDGNPTVESGNYIDSIYDLNIYGFSFKRENYEQFIREQLVKTVNLTDLEKSFSILVVHESPKQYGGGMSDEFFEDMAEMFDLILCGHIHQPFVHKNKIFNPGALETTKFNLYNEESGVIIFTINNDTRTINNVEKYITRRRRFHTIELESNLTGLGDIYTQLWQKKHLLENSIIKVIIKHNQDITKVVKENLEKYIKNTIQPLHIVSIKYIDLRDGVVREEFNTEDTLEIENIISKMFATGFDINLIYGLIKEELSLSQVEELYEKYVTNQVY